MISTAPELTETIDSFVDHSIIKQSRILVIDDSENNIKVLGGFLKKYNCDVLTALSAKKGLVIAEAKLPDLILLDVLMPEMNGFEAFEALKKNRRTQHIPVIFLTAAGNTENVVRGFEMGAADYITKPFNHQELIARIKNHLKLRMASEHMKALFNSKSHLFITINKNLEIINFNTSVDERNFLFTHETLRTGESIFNFIDGAEQAFVKRRIDNALKGKIVEFEKGFTVNNQTRWFNYIIEPIRNNGHEIIGGIISGTDITSKKETEMEDANYLEKINDMFEETQQGLRYAAYIQKAILPNVTEVSQQFDDSFVLFRPKDKVSGDFYWTHDLGDQSLLILGDCTGHGVPGALLTTISIVLLERIVKYQKIYSPEKILRGLNNNIVTILNQKDGGIRDGLEMAVCLFDKKNNTIEFAGAKRSMLIVKDGEAQEVKGTRQDIGGLEVKKYTKQRLYPEKGSAVYIFSDGYHDQIGGQDNKKFMKKKLKDLVLSLSDKTMKDQKKIFDDTITSWMGYVEQTDDILLIGVRV